MQVALAAVFAEAPEELAAHPLPLEAHVVQAGAVVLAGSILRGVVDKGYVDRILMVRDILLVLQMGVALGAIRRCLGAYFLGIDKLLPLHLLVERVHLRVYLLDDRLAEGPVGFDHLRAGEWHLVYFQDVRLVVENCLVQELVDRRLRQDGPLEVRPEELRLVGLVQQLLRFHGLVEGPVVDQRYAVVLDVVLVEQNDLEGFRALLLVRFRVLRDFVGQQVEYFLLRDQAGDAHQDDGGEKRVPLLEGLLLGDGPSALGLLRQLLCQMLVRQVPGFLRLLFVLVVQVRIPRRQQDLVVLVERGPFVDVWHDQLELDGDVILLHLLHLVAGHVLLRRPGVEVVVVRVVGQRGVVEHRVELFRLVYVTNLDERVDPLQFVVELVVADFDGGDPHASVLEELPELVLRHLNREVLDEKELGFDVADNDFVVVVFKSLDGVDPPDRPVHRERVLPQVAGLIPRDLGGALLKLLGRPFSLQRLEGLAVATGRIGLVWLLLRLLLDFYAFLWRRPLIDAERSLPHRRKILRGF